MTSESKNKTGLHKHSVRCRVQEIPATVDLGQKRPYTWLQWMEKL